MSPASTQPAVDHGSIPARAGIGLRSPHHADLLEVQPDLAFVEVHSENFFADGGAQIEFLARVRELYPVSVHGVGLSLGSTDPLNREHLWRLQRLVQTTQPTLVSEHLSWGSVDGIYLNDLLPLPYTEEALSHMVERVRTVQDYLGQQILIENVSSYLRYAHSPIEEWDFLAALAEEADCGLLLDVNNVYVSSRNHGFDARKYLAKLPATRVREIHLAGHSINRYSDREILIDTHSRPVCDDVWSLYCVALERFGPTPTLIEWDADLPPLQGLVAEARKADRLLEHCHALAA